MNYLFSVVSVLLYSLLIYWLVHSTSNEKPVRLMYCVLMGACSACISFVMEYLWNLAFGDVINAHRSLIILESFVGVSAIEESTKWIWLVLVIYRWASFDRYSNGILYACSIAAGFNLVEGILYVRTDPYALNTLIRGFTAVPVHFLFAIIMGFFFARFKLESGRFFWFAILAPLILHGLYDFFILQQYAELLLGGAILVFAGCFSLSVWVCRSALRADHLRAELN